MSAFAIDGIVPIIPTPFDKQEQVDWAAFRGLLDFARGTGPQAVCLPAYASEFYKLTEAERREAVTVAIAHLDGNLPVLAQVSYASTSQSIDSARRAQSDGASAICCTAPRIFSLCEADLFRHFDRVLAAIDIPCIVQDFNPGGSTVSPYFVAKLHRAHAHFRYVKLEEALLAPKVEAILQETSGEVGVIAGWGGMFMLELIPSGICGVMPGLGISDILASVFRSARKGNRDHAYELFQGVLPQIVYSLQNMELYHHAEKLLLQARGALSEGTVREATRSLREDEANHIRFLNAKILALLDHAGLPRNPTEKEAQL